MCKIDIEWQLMSIHIRNVCGLTQSLRARALGLCDDFVAVIFEMPSPEGLRMGCRAGKSRGFLIP